MCNYLFIYVFIFACVNFFNGAFRVTLTPISQQYLALKATGRVLLHLQWDGRTEQRKLGLSVRTSSPAWSARTSTTFLVSGLALSGPGVAMAPLPSTSLLQVKDAEGGVNRLVVGGSTGICITTTARVSVKLTMGGSVQKFARLFKVCCLLSWVPRMEAMEQTDGKAGALKHRFFFCFKGMIES